MKTIKILLFILCFFITGATLVNALDSSGSVTVTVNPPLAPSGTLTPPSSSCTITTGNSSCNVPLTWTTTNPVGLPAITSNYPSANNIVAWGNSGTNQLIAVPYLSSPNIFYLYSNAILLDFASATSSCAINTTWNGSVCALNKYLVSTSAGAGGSITPASSTVNHGYTTIFTVTPNSGYSIGSVSGCSGLRSGNNYATGPITAPCTVTATFLIMFGTLTPPSPSCTIASGASSCDVSLTWTTTNPIGTSTITSNYPSANTTLVVINNWDNWSFAVPYLSSPRTFYLYNSAIQLAFASATSSCVANNTWNGSVCMLNNYTVSTSAGSGGSITPASRTVNHGSTTTFTVTPNSGYTASASGCGGSLVGTTYTTGAITAACTVTATFSLILLAPTVTTNSITNKTQTTATSGGNVTSNGGSIVTVGGIVWSTSAIPTTGVPTLPTKTVNSNWADYSTWADNMTGLTSNTLYHVRAYATNSVGTSYGPDVQFTTIGVTSGTLTAIACTILAEGSTCPVTLNWTVSNPVGTSTLRTPNVASSPFYTSASGATSGSMTYPYTVSSAPSTATFYLVNNGFNTFATSTVSCVSNYHWDGTTGSCVRNAPTTTFTVSPSAIFKGRSATLTWSSPQATSCTSTGPGFDVSTHVPTSTSGSIVVSPLITTTYTLICTNGIVSDNNPPRTVKVIILNIKEQ